MKLIKLLACALALLALSGCKPASSPAGPTAVVQPVQNPEQSTTANTPSPVEAAAIVNGQPIPLATYQAQAETALAGYLQQPGIDPDSEDGRAAAAALRQQVLDWLIDQTLINQAAEREGIRVDNAAVDAEVERIRGEDPSGFADWLKANGFTEETFRTQTRSDLLAVAMRDRVTQSVAGTVEQVHLCHILVDSEAEARSLREQIRTSGVDFGTMARAYSWDEASRDNGGDIGFMPRGMLPESLEKVAFALKPGQISEPVESPFGWHLLQLVKKDPARTVSPEMLATLRQEQFMRWLDEERSRAQIQRLIP